MKRRLCAAALALALLLPAGCAREREPVEVALVLKTTVETAEFWSEVMDGVEAAAEEFGAELSVTCAPSETSIDEQIALLAEAVAARPDVIVLAASDYDRLAGPVDAAVEAGIPVLTMDSDVNTPRRTAFIASDSVEIGRQLGTQLLALVDEGEIAIISHSQVASSGIDRAAGAAESLAARPAIEVIGTYDCGNDLEEAGRLARRLLTEYPELRGFVCTNEVCNRGVAAELAAQDLAGKIMIVGCDNSQEQIQYLEQNAIQAIVIQRPFNMGYTAVEQAVLVAHGEDVPSFTEIPCVTITQDNMYNSENQKLLFPFKR